MFAKPRNGWTDILLGDFEGLGSYIQDVPVEAMDACIRALKNGTPLELHFDEEGSEFTLTADETIKIVAQGFYGPEEYEVKISRMELIQQILEDNAAYQRAVQMEEAAEQCYLQMDLPEEQRRMIDDMLLQKERTG